MAIISALEPLLVDGTLVLQTVPPRGRAWPCPGHSPPAAGFSSGLLCKWFWLASVGGSLLAGLVTPGMVGRSRGGVLVTGEFRHSMRNFRS